MALATTYERLSSTEGGPNDKEKSGLKNTLPLRLFDLDIISRSWRAPILVSLFLAALISTGALGYVWGIHGSTHNPRQFDNLDYGDFSWFCESPSC